MQNKKAQAFNFRNLAIFISLVCITVSSVQAALFTYTPASITPADGVLPDNACGNNPPEGVVVTFNVTDDFNIDVAGFGVNAGVNITHTWRGDLIVNLSSPTTADVELVSRVGGSTDNLNVLFDSDSANVLGNGAQATAPDFDTVVQPEVATALDTFDGEDAIGTWSLFVCDAAGADLGTLTNAELRFEGTLNVVPTQINGTVYKELNNDGTLDANEVGVANVTVTAYDSAGAVTATATTDANGDYSLTGLTDTQEYRLEFTTIPFGYQPSLEGVSSSTSVVFATSPVNNINYGVGSPAQYCQADPDLVTNLFRPLNQTTNPSLVSFPYSTTGTTAADIEANYNQIGSTWGLAYQSESDTLFASAYLKRHVEFGPGGLGAGDQTGSIYQIDNPSDGVLSTVSEFLNLNDIIGSNVTGTDPHPNAADLTVDAASYAQIGKLSFGDIDISEDSQNLWVTNLANRNLYLLPLGTDPAVPVVPTALQITAIDMLDSNNYVAGSAPACAGGNADNFRPFAVKYHQNSVFVGAVCSGETGGAGLEAHVYTLDTATLLFTEILNFALNYDRGCGLDHNQSNPSCLGGAGNNSANWGVWDSTYPPTNLVSPLGTERSNPQPMLSDIEFTNDEQMIIGIRDRFGDQTGHNQQAPDNSGLIRGEGYGDIVRATFNGTVWSFNSVEATNGTEYFSSDSWTDGQYTHFETGFGGLTSIPAQNSITMTNMDPINNGGGQSDFAGGVRSYDAANGTIDHSYQIYTDTNAGNVGTDFFGKANGVGDLEALCDTPTQEIGNRVWLDGNSNGVQDAGEAGIAGVVVQLIDTDGVTVLGTVTTDANGEFYFTNAAGVDVLGKDFAVNFIANVSTYLFRIDMTQGVLSGLNVTGLGGTGASSASNDLHDSDAVTSGSNAEITVATGYSGQSNHSYDFGFLSVPIADLSLNKTVNNSTPNVGGIIQFTVDVANAGPNDATNVSIVDTVPNGFSAISNITGGGVLAGNVITWSGVNIANGASVSYTFDVMVESTGVYNNLAEVTASDQLDSDSTPNNGVDTDSDGATNNDPGDEDDGDGEPVAPVVVPTGNCQIGNNDIGGVIFRDFNANGVQDVLEPGYGVTGMEVRAYNAAHVLISTAPVLANGSYVLSGISGVDYRLELVGLPNYLEYGASDTGGDSHSGVQFNNAANCAVDFGVNNPIDYCQLNPDFVVSRFTKDSRDGANSAINTLLQYNYLDNGTDAPTAITNYQNLGSVYGIAHLRRSNVTYASTYFKRHADIGPAGIGAIYKIDHNAGNAVSTFATLAGSDPRSGAGVGYDWNHDTVAYTEVGKRALGDIELSDDESQLFVVNMEDRQLYTLGVDVNGDLSSTSSVAIPNPCSNVLDYRPMGLGFNDGVLYVGVTCTAESTVDSNNVDDSYFGPRKGTQALLSAHVYSFDPVTSAFNGTPVLDIDLTYARGCGYDADISNTNPPGSCTQILDKDGVSRAFVADWNPWQMDYDIVFNDKNPGNIGNQDNFLEYQQPLLSDIEFDNDGTLIVQIKDVNGERTGHENFSPDPLNTDIHNGNSYGDIIRACGDAVTGWTLESNGSCGGVTTGGANNGEGPGGGEFYWYDNGPGGNGNINGSTAGHSETTMGGMLIVPGHLDVITGVMDPYGTSGIDTGLMWFQNSGAQAGQVSLDGGGIPKRLQVSIDANGAAFFGKASGMGDLEALCDPAPIEVGNRVWNDTDGDGIQGADEPGLDGITVTLSCGVDSTTAVTANGGQYYFSNATTVNTGTTQALFMDSGESCSLSVNNNQLALTSFALTTQNAGADTSNNAQTDVRDSDAAVSGTNSVISISIGGSGQNNHSYDFGFEPMVDLIDYGDAPDTGVGTGADNYQTTLADNGPSHVINNGLYMGAGAADSESDGQPNSVATGDDNVATADEDGPQSILNFTSGSAANIQVLVSNQTGVSATLSGWIDYNGDGVFDTVTEGATVNVPNGSMLALVTLTFPVVPAGPPPTSFLRLRLSTDAAALNPTGSAINGEVEDHRVTLNGDLTGSAELCYVVADGGDRLLTVDPDSGLTDDLAAGLGAIPYTSVETMLWDLGDPLVTGDETLYAADVNDLVQLLPTPRAVIGTFNNGITDSDGMAVDWQSTPPVYYGSGIATGNGHINLFNFNPANANVLNVTPDIVLPITNSQIDDIAWDPLNRRLIAVTNNGSANSHLVEFDLSNYPASVTAHDCGFIMYNDGVTNSILEDTEGLTFSRPGELYITTGDAGVAATRTSLFRVSAGDILADCSLGTQDINVVRIGAVNNLSNVPSGSTSTDHEAIDCGITFSESNSSIGNRVWLDEDSDGVQDANEDGIGGVTVYLCRANASPCNAGSAIRTEVTDASGGYLFSGIPVLDYIVAVDTATLASNLASNPTYDENSGTVNPDHVTTVSLTAIEEEYLTADFGYNWNSPTETGTPPLNATGSIGDRVWIDANADGVQNSNEAGINAVTVNLYSDPDGDSIYSNLVATTSTDGNGNYVFDNLPAGAYVVETNPLTLPAGVTWTQTGDPDDFGQLASAADHRTTDPVILAPGDVFVNADFGYQGDAASTSSIGDTVYLDANANGSEDGGEPGIANVTVSLLDVNNNPIASAVTDSNGQYLFARLVDGVYRVEITDTDNVLGALQQSADPDAILDNVSVVTLSGSNNLLQDFGYTPKGHSNGTGLIGDTVYMDVDGNSSQSATEPGLEGVRVDLLASNGFNFASTYTDENGQYQFGSLPDDTYTVVIDTTTLPNNGVGLVITDDPDGGADSQSVSVIAGANIDLNQDFGYQVTVANTVGGTLWNDNDADGTQDVSELARFSAVTVNLLDAQGNIIASTITDANGDYQFSGLADGTYTVSITDDSNVLSGFWQTLGSNPGSDLNSQVINYNVTVAGGGTDFTADFGFYINLASVGNIIYRDDNNDGVRNSATEPGIPLVPVTLTISYPNGNTVALTTLSDGAGFYSFEKLLADDSYTGDIADGVQPTYSLSVGSVANGYTSTYDGIADTSGIGNGTDDNSDNDQGESAFPVKGSQDNSNDFGYVPGGSIGNRVWLDLDNDGIQDANEEGIANRIVQLTPPPGVDIGAGAGVAITSFTDTQGNYIFTELPLAVGYEVTVTNPPAGLVQTYDEDGTGTANTSMVNLTQANEEYLSADFGYNVTAGTIGDYIWSDANGDGQQDPGEVGLDNITMYLCPANTFPCGAIDAIATTTTDATGRYYFTGVDPTVPHVVEVDTTTLPAGYVQTGDPDGFGGFDDQTTVPSLNTSDNINLDADFGYQPTIAANNSDIGDTLYIDLDSNGSEDAGEAGIPGVTVQLLIDTTGNSIPDTPIATVITDTNGQYLFPSLLNSNAYSVLVTDSNNILNGFDQTGDPDGGLDNQSTIANLLADNLEQDFGYSPIRKGSGIIGDRIFHDVNANSAQDAGDQGLEGVIVRLFNTNNDLVDVVVTNENGQYLFTGLDNTASYTVVVVTSSLPNGAAGWSNSVDPDGGLNSESFIDLSLIPSGIDLAQDFGYIGADSNTIEGTVWSDNDGNGLLTDGLTPPDPDETANGIENVTVVLKDTNGNIVASTTTDANGNYSFTGLPNGSYAVSVTDDNNELANLIHTDGPNAGDNLIDNNSQDDTGYTVAVSGGETNTTADFGYKPVITTPITLASFKTVYDASRGVTDIYWSTLTETGNVGFELYAMTNGQWLKINENLIASKNMYKTSLTEYHFSYEGEYVQEWAIVDVDIKGKRQSHGPFSLNRLYGQEGSVIIDNTTPWEDINESHNEKLQQRDEQKANDINQYIEDFINDDTTNNGEGS